MSLMALLPGVWSASPEMAAVQAALEPLIERVQNDLSVFLAQLDVNTATWGLALWEAALGLEVELSRPLDFRRTRAVSKLRGQGTTTRAMIQNVAASFSGGEVEVSEFPAEYRIEVKFVNAIGLPPNLDDLQSAIADIIPAHIRVDYVAKLHVWSEVGHMTWDEAAEMTWAQLRGGTL